MTRARKAALRSLRSIVVAFVVGVVVGGAYSHDPAAPSGTCLAPCVVTFDQPMEEDEFGIDYAGGRLVVFRQAPR